MISTQLSTNLTYLSVLCGVCVCERDGGVGSSNQIKGTEEPRPLPPFPLRPLLSDYLTAPVIIQRDLNLPASRFRPPLNGSARGSES